jgi:hypothetical protein
MMLVTTLVPSLLRTLEARRFRYRLYVAIDKGDWLEQHVRRRRPLLPSFALLCPPSPF